PGDHRQPYRPLGDQGVDGRGQARRPAAGDAARHGAAGGGGAREAREDHPRGGRAEGVGQAGRGGGHHLQEPRDPAAALPPDLDRDRLGEELDDHLPAADRDDEILLRAHTGTASGGAEIDVSEPHEPSYYEIALTNRQVVIAFVILLGCLLAAFFSGVWIGRGAGDRADREQVAHATSPAPPAAEGRSLEELKFFTDQGKKRGRQQSQVGLTPPPAQPAPPAAPPAAPPSTAPSPP